MFGTVLNRFCIEAAIGHPLTVYGKGGQTRGFLDIRDTVRCIELAVLHPPKPASTASSTSSRSSSTSCSSRRWWSKPRRSWASRLRIEHLADPRVEAEEHYYNAKHTALLDLGLQPHYLGESLLDSLLTIAIEHRDRVDPNLIFPRVDWRQGGRVTREPVAGDG